jgi:hypothetical protein
MQRRAILIVVGAAVLVAGVFLLATLPHRSSSRAPAGEVPSSPAELLRHQLSALAATLPEATPTDPTAPGYSPEKLLKVAGFDVIYEAEPRTEPWASRVEAALGPQLDREGRALVRELASVKLECHTTMCAVRWTWAAAPAPDTVRRWFEMLRQLFPGSGRFHGDARLVYWSSPTWDGDVRHTEAFIAAATVQIVEAGRFLRTPAGNRRVNQQVAIQAARERR